MGRYNKFQNRTRQKPQANPLWRGYGCILMVALPLVTFGLTVTLTSPLVATGLVPLELLGYVNFPAWVFRVPFLAGGAIFLRGIDNLWLGVIVFFVIMLLLTAIGSLVYVAVLQVVGPPRYSELDAPPTGYKPKKYTR